MGKSTRATGQATDAPIRIVVADVPEVCHYYEQWLPSLAYQLVGMAHTGRELVERCLALRPDLVITELDLPGLDGIAASVEINRDKEYQVPTILVTKPQEAAVLERCVLDHVMAYLTKPVKPADLAAAIRLALVRFGHYREALGQAAELGQALADRKLIERAKGVIMKQSGLDEADAFARLQRMASDRNRKLVDAARDILVAEEVFHMLGPKQ